MTRIYVILFSIFIGIQAEALKEVSNLNCEVEHLTGSISLNILIQEKAFKDVTDHRDKHISTVTVTNFDGAGLKRDVELKAKYVEQSKSDGDLGSEVFSKTLVKINPSIDAIFRIEHIDLLARKVTVKKNWNTAKAKNFSYSMLCM